jgi:hypothetical protein
LVGLGGSCGYNCDDLGDRSGGLDNGRILNANW